jgi:hypothetical protein
VALADPPNVYGQAVSATNHYEPIRADGATALVAKRFDEREEADLPGSSKDVNCLDEFKKGPIGKVR